MGYTASEFILPENSAPGIVSLVVRNVDFLTSENLDFPLPGNFQWALRSVRAYVRTAPSAVTTAPRLGLSKVVSGTATALRGSVPVNAAVVSAADELYDGGRPGAGIMYLENVAAATTSGLITQVSNLTAAGTATVGASTLKVPRKLVVTLSDAAGSNLAGTVTLVGTTPAGDKITEVVTVVAATVSYTTANVFATLTAVTYDFSSASGGTGAASDTLDIGMSTSLGLPLRYSEVTKLVSAGTAEAVSSADIPAGSFVATTAPNATNDYTVYYRSGEAVDSLPAGATLRLAVTAGSETGSDKRDVIVDLFRW